MEKVIIYRDNCIACGACITYCPYGALIPDEEGKPILLWDRCNDDFACIYVCPVSAIKRASQAERIPVAPWYRLSSREFETELKRWLGSLSDQDKDIIKLS
ncbi:MULTISPECIES: ATP-binding protein [Pyrobaculum]|uniref:4Fe-4S ferredoxin, iron-sulfur binding domain protein n=2 Tax=Pyrobaculum arsenaticum TaxID=121277 RepID=A4WID1_PYRAR|nr:4Fe-4S binding protein [Pyrobaculum arsenaticum]ABP50148.1 4Fe-4S ferredoxin, iron-sulfur binding domain protein [Pyrobaculum arsenaticum DSM 13514]MCY0889702.1 4Fe-4S binding protein [Pyrobaculum arsenaticum]NYR14925.1 4Fe-4S binding protein [Pyrobaculum arsenaticum]